jgi:hypothetical protein
MIKKLDRLFAAAVTVALLLSACVREKGEYCHSGLLLHYHYDLNPSRENRFEDEVHKLTILAFDENGRFYEAFDVSDSEALVEENLISLPLPDGNWTVVTWGGDMDTYNLGKLNAQRDVDVVDYHNGSRGAVTLDEHRVWVSKFTYMDNGSKLVTDDLSPLFYGQVTARAVTGTTPTPHTEVNLMRNTNTLGIRLDGLPADATPGRTRAHEDNVTVHAEMVNGRCRADNEICLDALNVHYEQTHAISSTETSLDVDLTVMRLFLGDDVSAITISGTFLEHHGYPEGKITIPIVPAIIETLEFTTQEELDRENYYEFALDFDNGLAITINNRPWRVIDVTPGI